MINFNRDAQENFDNKAREILTRMKVLPPPPDSPPRIPTGAHIETKITDSEILGDVKQFTVDAKGKVFERSYAHNGKRIGLAGADYKLYSSVAENVQRLKGIHEKISVTFVQEALFTWLRENFETEHINIEFSKYLKSVANAAIRKIDVYVPIALMSVESPFSFGGIIIQNITKEFLDAQIPSLESIPHASRKHAEEYFNKFRSDFQGYAAAKLELECEPHYAKELSLEKARSILDLISIYSGKALIPDSHCASRLKGSEFIEHSMVLILGETGGLKVNQEIVRIDSIETWIITESNLSHYREFGFDKLSVIFESGGANDFEKSILSMAYLYAKSALTGEPMEKIVYILSALESMLLKNETESLQQNLGERLAFFSADNLEDRKKTIRNFKNIYALRSRYLHHGHTSNELSEIQYFLENVWEFFVRLISAAKNFKSSAEFLTYLDDLKLS